MSYTSTLAECFRYNAWALERLLTIAADLSDEQRDRPFDIGRGTLRTTLQHIYGAERVWFVRWQTARADEFPHSSAISVPDALWRAFRDLASARNETIASLDECRAHQQVRFEDPPGRTHTRDLRDILLHVCNHGAHHRAQALNMLRRLGIEPPWLDYLAYFRARSPEEPLPAFDKDTLLRWYQYGDATFDEVCAAAARMTEAQLDQPFEIGLGSLRATLLHICFAEQWWLENWRAGPGGPFPELPDSTPIDELRRLFARTAADRDAYLCGLADDDLSRTVKAQPRPDKIVGYPLGSVLLQLCHHGTHHRAQAANMLRYLGAQVPQLDYELRLR